MNRTVNLSRSHRNESEEWRFWVHKGDDSSAITEKRHKMADSRSCSSFFPRVDKLRRQRAGEENSVQWKLCIDEQAGLPISKPPFFKKLANYRGFGLPQTCVVDKSSVRVAFLYWLAHEEWQTWTLPLKALQIRIFGPFCISCFFSTLNKSVTADKMCGVWKGETWKHFFCFVFS